MDYQARIDYLISHPEELIKKKPFTRGVAESRGVGYIGKSVGVNEYRNAIAPSYRMNEVTQEQFKRELDQFSHAVLFDENIPSICMKTKEGGYLELQYQRLSVPFQRNIKNKQLLHLTGNKLVFTLVDTDPDETITDGFVTFKQYWELRNQDGMKTKMVDAQLSYGDAGLLYYFNRKGEIKSRLLSYEDGFVLCPHNDDNGERLIESVYYVKDDIEYIDSYDDTYMYRHKRGVAVSEDEYEKTGWILESKEAHGFEEIPLITKRGDVAWNNVQHIITSYEILYNVFNAIQRRHGWGLLYIKGKFSDKAQKIAGSIILNDTSLEGKGDAKFLTPPNPEGTIETLQLMLDSIQLGASTTFILPKDIKTSGDISGIAIQLTQSLDLENALQKVIEWQNVADKMVRLFKYGLSKELVEKGINPTAVTDFAKININAKFKVWRPMNDYEYNQMLTILTGAGILSKETGIQKNTESTPDEHMRIEKEDKKAMEKQQAMMEQQNNNGNGSNQQKGKEDE
jgi:hypothetical protein